MSNSIIFRASKDYPELIDQLKELAKKDGYTINDYMEKIFVRFIHNQKKPTLQDIYKYATETKSKINPDRFFAYYNSKGWMVGGSPVINWKSVYDFWEINYRDKNKPKSYNQMCEMAQKLGKEVWKQWEFITLPDGNKGYVKRN